ncbi:MAG: hypothetical protein NTX31_00125 [Burkholderiales bacterium]|jgi:hypothetical protein|nr:hypothetical protein [Burkholderiales bacterium]
MKKLLEATPKKAGALEEPPEVHPYAANDPIPLPEVSESDSDTDWALWEKSVASNNKNVDPSFANTVPDELATQPAPLRPKR